MTWSASGSATLVGSMPHRDREKVLRLILEQMTEIPVWPQLAGIEAEQMMIQYNEGLPGLRREGDRLWVETDTPEFEEELLRFYEDYLAVDADEALLAGSRFRLGEESGKTFFRFLEEVQKAKGSFRAVKGQVVGPFTLLAGLKDRNGRALLYDERFQDVVPKHLAMKARWQAGLLKNAGAPVILFVDEPALAGFGSSTFVSVSKDLIQQLLGEVMVGIHWAGALAGVHVCANTDWSLAFDSPVDIINFDAYSYFDRFALYRDDFLRFTQEGRTVAWGMVPTADAEAIGKETARSLTERWLRSAEALTSPELSLGGIVSRSLFTPTCGCGTLPEQEAERVVTLTRELSESVRKEA